VFFDRGVLVVHLERQRHLLDHEPIETRECNLLCLLLDPQEIRGTSDDIITESRQRRNVWVDQRNGSIDCQCPSHLFQTQ